MKLTKVTGTYEPIIVGTTEDTEKQASTPNYTNYQSVPTTYTRVAYRNSATDPKIDANSIGSSLTTTYAAYISPNQPAGTYAGQVKYTLTHPASEEPTQPRATTSGQICYYANASSAVGTMGCQTIPNSGTTNDVSPTSAVLLASNFSRTGYGFAGWSDAYDYATNSNAHFYGPQEYITFTEGQYSGDNAGLSLYAVWVKSAGNLQGWNGCSSLTTAPTNGTANLASVTALTDQRDNETYAVARLADGNCWMIENLRLEAGNTKGQNQFNSSITNESLAQGYGKSTTYGNFSGLADAENTNFTGSHNSSTASTPANSLYYAGTQEGTASVDIKQTSYAGSRIPRYNNWNNQSISANRPQNPTTNSAINNSTNAGMYSYGNYYNWSATMATTVPYGNSSSSETISTSICPSGWRIPRGGTKSRMENGTNDYYTLSLAVIGVAPSNYASYDYPNWVDDNNTEGTDASNAMRAYPNNLVYSGSYLGSSPSQVGTTGSYWSSIASGYYSSHYLLSYKNNIRPGTGSGGKYNGMTVRCMVLVGV